MEVIIPPDMQLTWYQGERATPEAVKKLAPQEIQDRWPELDQPQPPPPLPLPSLPGWPDPAPEASVGRLVNYEVGDEIWKDLRDKQLRADRAPVRLDYELPELKRPDWAAVPLPPPNSEQQDNFNVLEQLQRERGLAAGTRSDTGLPSFLFGPIADPIAPYPDQEPCAPAKNFINENDFLLSGTKDVTQVELEREYMWAEDTYQVHFRQVNGQQVPLYGAGIALTYAGNQLIFVSNALCPALPEQIDGYEWDSEWDSRFRQKELQAESLAIKDLPERLKLRSFEAPVDLRKESREQQWMADRWILPYIAQDNDGEPEDATAFGLVDEAETQGWGQGAYRPVWRTIAVDENERRWLLLVDAETGHALIARPTWVHAPLKARAFETSQHAAAGNPTEVDLGEPDDLTAHVVVSGDRGKDLTQPAGPSATAQEIDARLLTATVYHHVRKMQKWLEEAVGQLNLRVNSTDSAPSHDPSQRQEIFLADEEMAAEFEPNTRRIRLGKGVPGAKPIREPGFDGDLIAHEFVHAITRFLNPAFFEYGTDDAGDMVGGLDEGLAFILPCLRKGDPAWARYAYDPVKWNDVFNFAVSSALLSKAAAPPMDDIRHTYGIWWARVFWAMHNTLGTGSTTFESLLLQAITALMPPTNDFEAIASGLMGALTSQNVDVSPIRSVFQTSGLNV